MGTPFVLDAGAVLVGVVALWLGASRFVAGAAAIRQGRFEVSAGNVFGSCVVNLLGVLGLAAALRPLVLSAVAVEASLGLCVVTVLAVGLAVSKRAVSRAEGTLLLAVGLADWVIVALFG